MRLFLRSWVFLGIFVGIHSELVKRQANGVESNSMSLEPGESHDEPVIDIDKQNSGDETDAIDVDYSGDSDDEDYNDGSGSGDEPETPVVVTPAPKTKTEPPITTRKPTKAPKVVVTEKPKKNKPEPTENNNIPEEVEFEMNVTDSNEIGPPVNVVFTNEPGLSENEAQTGSETFMELLFSNPAILAAIIAGGVIALLSAILLVMFIVYRMRKKDEGSYSLDEPKKYKDPNMYWKDTGKEFYA